MACDFELSGAKNAENSCAPNFNPPVAISCARSTKHVSAQKSVRILFAVKKNITYRGTPKDSHIPPSRYYMYLAAGLLDSEDKPPQKVESA